MDDSSRAEQQVIAKQAAISHLDRRVSELRDKRTRAESQKQAEARSLKDQKIAIWWRSHPDIKTDHLEVRRTVLFWLALILFILILLRVQPLTQFVTARYEALNTRSPQDIALFLAGSVVGLVALSAAFITFYYLLFLLPFVDIPKWQLERHQRELTEQRMAISRQAEQEATREIETKYAPAMVSIDHEIREAEGHIEKLKKDMDRLTMGM